MVKPLHTHMKTIAKIAIASCLVFLAGCMDDLNFSNYEIVSPQQGKVYIGAQSRTPSGSDKPLFPENIEIAYKAGTIPPGNQVNVVLNGHKVGHLFNHTSTGLIASYDKVEQYFRHGQNTLTVEPSSFGPSITFDLDAKGPAIIITKAELAADKKEVAIEGFLRDYSELSNILEVSTYNITGYENTGALKKSTKTNSTIAVDPASGVFSGSVSVDGKLEQPLIYELKATDRYGFSSRKEFLADTGDSNTTALPLQNAVQIAIGSSLIQAMRPLISNSLYETLSVAPMWVKEHPWNDTKICEISSGNMLRGTVENKAYTQLEYDRIKAILIENGNATPTNGEVFSEIGSCKTIGDTNNCNCNNDNDGSTLPVGFNPMRANLSGDIDLYVYEFYMDDGTLYGQQGTMLLNDFSLADNNEMNVDLAITNIIVDIEIKPKNGIIVLAGDMRLKLGFDQVFVNAVAKASAKDKKVDIRLDEGRTSISFGSDPEVVSGSIWGGLPIGGLLDLLMPLIKGLIGDMTPGIINSILATELQNLVIGGVLTQPETGASFDMAFDVAQLKTQSSLGEHDLFVALDSTVKVINKDASGNVNSTLGPVFVEDPISPLSINNEATGSNITAAINSNLINQALNAVFSTGVSHFTLHNGKTYHGGNILTPLDPNDASKTLAQKGETRIRLWPDMPPIITFLSDDLKGQSRAAVEYESATLYWDTAKEVNGEIVWENTIKLKVNFDLAVNISEKDGAFVMGAAGPPVFQINEMVNTSKIQIPQAIIQRVIDLAMSFGGNLLAGQDVVFDLGKIIGDTLNGTEVKFLSAGDIATMGEGEYECIVYDKDGNASAHPNATTVNASAGDGKYDLVCQTIDMRVSTETVDVKGLRGGNLFFQMTAEDSNAAPRMGIPHFDLDGDGVADLRGDNCAMPTDDIITLYREISTDNSALAGEVDENGVPSAALHAEMRNRANRLLAKRFGANNSEADLPSAADYAHYNTLRFWGNDTHITGGSYPWLRMMYNNPSQSNIDGVSQSNPDGDRIGDLCEDDSDRDGIWASYDGIENTSIPMPITPATPTAGSYLLAKNDNCPAMYNPDQLDTKQPIGVGDACNVRNTYVMLRSYESQFDTAQSGGEPMCLTHEGLINNNLFSLEMHTMKVCNPSDVNQHWFMRAVNNLNLDDGVEFYTNASRNPATASRLIAFGEQIEDACSVGGKTSWTRVQELRLVNRDNNALWAENAKNYRKAGGTCNERNNRGDPIWYPELVSGTDSSTPYEETLYPWIIRTLFDFNFGKVHSNDAFEGVNACMTYAQGGWGVDIDSLNETHSCITHGVQMKHRWSIWAGSDNAPWNGTW